MPKKRPAKVQAMRSTDPAIVAQVKNRMEYGSVACEGEECADGSVIVSVRSFEAAKRQQEVLQESNSREHQ